VRIAVVGLGAVGLRVGQQLLDSPQAERVTLIGQRPPRDGSVEAVFDDDRVDVRGADRSRPGEGLDDHDVVVLAAPGDLWPWASAALAVGAHVVAVVDDPPVIRSLLALEAEARERRRVVAVGAAMAPGLSCLITALLAQGLDVVAEIHVASFGTGGPECARRHHRALSQVALDWRHGAWRRHAGGSGRELVWFPEPVGGADCYRAALADPLLLAPAFPDVRRVSARVAATRRDRMSAWMPMLRPPHPEGTLGAVRTEVRGWRDGRPEDRIGGAVSRPAVAAAAVAAQCAEWAAAGRLSVPGAGSLARLVPEPGAFLGELVGRGVHTSVFEGASAMELAEPAADA
jgi:saccharopine dehydrogenase-like NADP-dependent oxidoreductase